MKKRPHCEAWDSFPDFYTWSVQNDYTLGARLRLIDDFEPYSPENCVWINPKDDMNDLEFRQCWADKWNETVNRIRKYYGMPPLG